MNKKPLCRNINEIHELAKTFLRLATYENIWADYTEGIEPEKIECILNMFLHWMGDPTKIGDGHGWRNLKKIWICREGMMEKDMKIVMNKLFKNPEKIWGIKKGQRARVAGIETRKYQPSLKYKN